MPDSPAHSLTFTGERFAPEVTGAIWYEHWHRYCAVQPLAKGMTVLDAACGEGYGSYLLAQTAKDVVGIDIAPEAVTHARSRYAAANLRYLEGSCTALPLEDGSVDLIVSFETIEHLWDQAAMLAEFRRVLAPGGALVISSPNQPVYSEYGAHVNDFHVRELTRDELAALLDPGFPQQRWYAQRLVAHSALWAESSETPAPRKSLLLSLGEHGVHADKAPGPAMYFVVVCGAKDATLPALPPLSLFDDGRQSLYADYTRALLREKQLYWEELDARKVAEDRLAELIAVTNDLASERQKSATLEDRVAAAEEAYREQSTSLPARIRSLEAAVDASQAELAVERDLSSSLTWEERNARAIADARLAELITTVNIASSEREKAATLAARVSSLEADLAAERERRAALVWEERNSRTIADDRLAELIVTVNALSSEREKSATLADASRELARVLQRQEATQAALVETENALRQANDEATRRSAALAETQSQLTDAEAALTPARAALTESQSRLAFRETAQGWLRFPLAWLRMRLRGPG